MLFNSGSITGVLGCEESTGPILGCEESTVPASELPMSDLHMSELPMSPPLKFILYSVTYQFKKKSPKRIGFFHLCSSHILLQFSVVHFWIGHLFLFLLLLFRISLHMFPYASCDLDMFEDNMGRGL